MHKAAQASLHQGLNLKDCVKLPKGECLEDWFAVHVVDFFNRINLIYGIVTEYCTGKTHFSFRIQKKKLVQINIQDIECEQNFFT